MSKEVPDTFHPDEFDVSIMLDDGTHQDKVASIIAKHLRSSRPLSRPFRNLVADWIERKPQPPVKGQKRKKYPTEGLEIWADFLKMTDRGCSDASAYRLLAQGFKKSTKTIKRTLTFYRRAAEL
jgi:hypothetical protein